MFAWADKYDVQETRRIARAEGLAEGRSEGERDKALTVAKKMLNRDETIDKIVEFTGLTVAEVEALRE